MILYAVIIISSIALTGCLNGAFGIGWEGSFAWVGIAVAIMVVIDAVTAIIVHAVPERKIDPFAEIFMVSQRERRFYEKLGVKTWKDVIPESGKYLCHFAKDKIAEPNNNLYVLKFLRETCYAEIMHVISFVLSFVPLIFMPYRLQIVLPIVLTNALLQVLPVIVQRYNRNRLVKLYRYNERKNKMDHNRTPREPF